MSFEASAWAKRQTAGSPEAKLVLLLLGDTAGADGECWLAAAALAGRAEMSNTQLEEILTKLVERGAIYDVTGNRELILLPVNQNARDMAADPILARAYFEAQLEWRNPARLRDSNR